VRPRTKQWLIGIGAVLVLGKIFGMCQSQKDKPSVGVPPAAQPASSSDTQDETCSAARAAFGALPPLSERVVLHVLSAAGGKVFTGRDGKLDPVPAGVRPTLIGLTNLPNGTELIASLNGVGFGADAKATVVDGCFIGGPFSHDGQGLTPGVYHVDITVPMAMVQPDAVRAVIGERAENLRGELVHRDKLTNDATVEQRIELIVGESREAAERADKAERQEAIDVVRRIETLIEQGRTMEPLRRRSHAGNLDALRECGERMRALQAQADAVRSRVHDGPSDLIEHARARGAFAYVHLCVSCTDHAQDDCKRAAQALKLKWGQ